jgi:hypothetical protein
MKATNLAKSAMGSSPSKRNRYYSDNDDALVGVRAPELSKAKSDIWLKVSACLEEVKAQNEADRAKVALLIVRRNIRNILRNPTDENSKLIKVTNRKLQQTLLNLKPDGVVIRLLEALGFTRKDEDYYVFKDRTLENLNGGSRIISDAIDDFGSGRLPIPTITTDEESKTTAEP